MAEIVDPLASHLADTRHAYVYSRRVRGSVAVVLVQISWAEGGVCGWELGRGWIGLFASDVISSAFSVVVGAGFMLWLGGNHEH